MTYRVTHFPSRVQPNSDELLDDWFLRLEVQNHHAESVWSHLITEALGYQMELDKLNFVEDPNLLEFLAYVARLERGELQVQPYRDYAQILSIAGKTDDANTGIIQSWVRFIDNTVSICPLCLQEQLYIRKYWHLGFVAICSRHKLWLSTRCLHCGNPWKWRNVLLNRCPNCQNEATILSKELSVDDELLLKSHQHLDAIFNQESDLALTLLPLDKPHRFFLLFGIAELISKVSADWSYLIHHRCSVTGFEYCSPKRLSNFLNYATAFQAIDRWPESFYRFLDQYRLRNGKQDQRGLNHEFGALYSKWIKNRWANGNFAFVQEAFKTYLENEFIPYEQFKKAEFAQKNPSMLTESNFITLEQATAILNTSLAQVLNYIFSGQLHLFRAKYEPIEYLKKSEVEKLARSLR